MVDIWSRKKRSDVMSRIRSKNTEPEMRLRSALHKMGFRFKLHDKNLPGRPDLVFPKYYTVIFVNGCFWHMHAACSSWKMPRSNVKYWRNKLSGNVLRDGKKSRSLRKLGWSVLTVWECEIERDLERVAGKIGALLRKNQQKHGEII